MHTFNPFQHTPLREPQNLWGYGLKIPFYSNNPSPFGGRGYPPFPNTSGVGVAPYSPDDDAYIDRDRNKRAFRRGWEYDGRSKPKA